MSQLCPCMYMPFRVYSFRVYVPPCVCPSMCMSLPARTSPPSVDPSVYMNRPWVCLSTCMTSLCVCPSACIFLYVYVVSVYMSFVCMSPTYVFFTLHYVHVLSLCIHSTPEVYFEIALVWWGVIRSSRKKDFNDLVRE